jgi:hypothetical protein
MEILAPDEYRHCTMIYSYIISKYLGGPDHRSQLTEKLKEYGGLLIKDAEDYGSFLEGRV